MKWLVKTIREERRALERARRRFVRKPSEERLHDVRTTGRRFRSLLEDVADLIAAKRFLRRIKSVATATDAARDATIILRLLERSVEANDVAAAQPLLDELRKQNAQAMRLAQKHLRRARFLR